MQRNGGFERRGQSIYIGQRFAPGVGFMRAFIGSAAVLLVLGLVGCSSNEKKEPSLKEGAREVGHAVGNAAREVGQGAKKAGKAVGEAAKEGGKAFRDAVKGE
jgi:hypothetical protein